MGVWQSFILPSMTVFRHKTLTDMGARGGAEYWLNTIPARIDGKLHTKRISAYSYPLRAECKRLNVLLSGPRVFNN